MMVKIVRTALVVALLVPVAGWAAVTPYSQDFESLAQGDTGALATWEYSNIECDPG